MNWKFILDAKRSIFGVTLSWFQGQLKNSLFRHHSVHLLNVCDSLPASMFSWPGMQAINTIRLTDFSPDCVTKADVVEGADEFFPIS